MQRPTVMPIADHLSTLPPLTLVLGGARSGKSRYAESLFAGRLEPIYLATAQAGDAEMTARIRHHQQRRGDRWQTVEEPLDLVLALEMHARPGRAILVDCLTLWLTNVLLADLDVEAECERLASHLVGLNAPVVFVSNEVGLGIVPDNALTRAFRDHAGWLNQKVAARCQRVVFVAAGLPLLLKDIR